MIFVFRLLKFKLLTLTFIYLYYFIVFLPREKEGVESHWLQRFDQARVKSKGLNDASQVTNSKQSILLHCSITLQL